MDDLNVEQSESSDVEMHLNSNVTVATSNVVPINVEVVNPNANSYIEDIDGEGKVDKDGYAVPSTSVLKKVTYGRINSELTHKIRNDNFSIDDLSLQKQHNAKQNDVYQVERILASKRKKTKLYFLVKWKGYSQPTWEKGGNIPFELKKNYFTENPRRKKRHRV